MGQTYSEEAYDPVSSPMVKSYRLVTEHSDKLRAVWKWHRPHAVSKEVLRVKVFYQYADQIKLFKQPTRITDETTLTNLRANTRYRVCIDVRGQLNDTVARSEQHCLTASTTMWHTSASIGSSVGALLALAIILLMLLVSQRSRRRRRLRRGANAAASKRSRLDSTFESQFDSMVIRDENAFYDGDEESSCVPETSEQADSVSPNLPGSKSPSIFLPNGIDADVGNAGASNDALIRIESVPLLSREVKTVTFEGDSAPQIINHDDRNVPTDNEKICNSLVDHCSKQHVLNHKGHCPQSSNKVASTHMPGNQQQRRGTSIKHVIQMNDTDHYTIDLMRCKPAPEPSPSPNEPPSPPPPPPPPPPNALLSPASSLPQDEHGSSILDHSEQTAVAADMTTSSVAVTENICAALDMTDAHSLSYNMIYTQLIETL